MRVWEDRESEEVKYHRGPAPLRMEADVMSTNKDVVESKVEETKVKMEKAIYEAEVEGRREAKTKTVQGEADGDMSEDDDDAWEEKVRREIEGEAD